MHNVLTLEKIQELPVGEGMGSGDNAPSTPMNLSASVYSSTVIELFWDRSTDDMIVVGYDVYRDGVSCRVSWNHC